MEVHSGNGIGFSYEGLPRPSSPLTVCMALAHLPLFHSDDTHGPHPVPNTAQIPPATAPSYVLVT